MSQKEIVAILLCASMVLAAGCTGWGEDGPANPEAETDGNGEEEAEEVTDTDGASDEGSDTESGSSNGSSGDSDSTEVNVEVDDSSSTSVSSSSESSASSSSSSSSSSASDSGEVDAGNDGDGSEDTNEGEEEEGTKTADMRVYAEDTQTGEYVEGIRITVENRKTGETYTGTTAEGDEFNGTYHNFEDLPLGTYQLTAEGTRHETATNVVKLTQSGRQPILHMDREYEDGRVTLTVVDQFGEPVTAGHVRISRDSTDGSFTKNLDENGQVEFRASPDDTYYYSLHADGYQTESVHGEIDPSEETRKTIEVERSVHQLTVPVGGPTLSAIPTVTIRRHVDGATTKRAGTGGKAVFDVYTGTYTIITEDDDERHTKTVTVTADVSVKLRFDESKDH